MKANVARSSPLEINATWSNAEPEKIGQSAVVMYHASFMTM